MSNKLNKFISNAIVSLLKEEGEILTRGSFGTGGRARAFVTSAKARAESDPESLLKDLGIKGPVAGGDLEKVQRILNAAIHSNSVMSQAYLGTRTARDKPKNGKEKIEVLSVTLGGLDRKNGIRYLAHTLTAAKNAGFLNLKNSIQFAEGEQFPIIIYSVEQ